MAKSDSGLDADETAATSQEITLEGLLPSSAHRHFVHALGCPSRPTGLCLAVRNALPYLHSAASVYHEAPWPQWLESVDQLHDLLVDAADRHPTLLSTSAEDAKRAPYSDFLKSRRSTLPDNVARAVEAELARSLIAYTSNAMPFPGALMHGFVCMLKSGGRASPLAAAWRRLAERLPLTRDAIKEAQQGPLRSDVKRFLAALTRSLGLELRSPSALEPRSPSRASDRASEEAHAKEATASEEAPDEDLDDDDEEDVEPRFEGSFLGWLVKAGQEADYRHRFGVEDHWDRQTLRELQHVCAKIRQALRTPGPQRLYAYLAQISLLTSLPAHLAIRIPIGPNDDLFLLEDLTAVGWHWPRVLKRKRGKASTGSSIDHTRDVLVPQSEDAVEAGRDLRERHPAARSLIELLIGTDEDWAIVDFLKDFKKWLTSLGLGWLHGVRWARFAKSFSQLYRSQASDIVAAILGLDFREVAMGTLHYVALPAEYIDEQVAMAYERIGWGRPVPLCRLSPTVGSLHALPLERFAEALSDLARACDEARAHVLAAKNPASLIAHFNELVHLRQLQAITLMAGRGNRIGGLTWYTLYGHADYVMLGDKDTDYYSFFRLLPMHRHLLDALGQHISDIEAFVGAARKLELVTVDFEKRFPKSPAFVAAHLKREGSALLVRSSPTQRKRLQELAKRHLKGPINTGRHSILSLAVLGGVDGWLIKALSGHRRGTAEPFADGGAVSPRHALCLLQSALDWLLREVRKDAAALETSARFLVPLSALSERITSPPIRTGRRRRWLARVLGPPCDQHTITALRVIEQVRDRLVTGGGPERADADLLLSAMVLNWLERTDLEEWWQQDPFRSLRGAVPVAVWRRKKKPGEVIRPLEAPVALALLRIKREMNGEFPAWADTCDAVAAWLRAAVPGVNWPARSREAVNVLSALMLRWARIQAPPFILAAASRRLASATANRLSILRLAGEARHMVGSSEPLPGFEPPERTPRRARPEPSVMTDIMALIHAYGRTDERKGEDQQRWKDLLHDVQKIDCRQDSRARALRTWIEREARLWTWDARANEGPLDDDADLLQVNSARRYLTRLTPGLERILPSEAIESWGEDEWYEWVDVLVATTRGDKQEKRREAGRQTLVAAHRFLRALSLRGYPIPPSLLESADTGEIDSIRRAAAATLLLAADRARIVERVSTHFGDIPIVGHVARLYVLLLFAASLRSTECAVLPLKGLSLFDALAIASGGWSHLKSIHAKRLIPIPTTLADEIRAVVALLETSIRKSRKITKAEKRQWFFLLGGEQDWSLVRALSSAVVIVMREATADPDARLHSTRSVAPLNELLVEWEPELRALLDGSATPDQCRAYCTRIQAAGFDHLIRVIIHTGHGHPHTYVEYYFSVWPLLLSLFARASLAGCDAPLAILQRHPPDASAALRRAQRQARDTGAAFDTWGWMTAYAGGALDLPPLQQCEPGN